MISASIGMLSGQEWNVTTRFEGRVKWHGFTEIRLPPSAMIVARVIESVARSSLMLEIVKLLATFLSGGLAGAIVAEYFRRRRSRIQHVSLIERVNRLVSPVEGFTLARMVGNQLERVQDVREYQLTMRNSTPTHLQNAELQFDFPADDVQAVVSRPTLSRTPLVPMDATADAPWKKAFRWKIPHFPSGDAVEFTFRAVAPSSATYEAALYHTGVIFEKIVGEPPPEKKGIGIVGWIVISSIIGIIVTILVGALTGRLPSDSGEKLTKVKAAGCDLNVVSLYEIYDRQSLYSPWQIKHRIFNVGTQDCVIESKELQVMNPVTLKPGEVFDKETVSDAAPHLVNVNISVDAANTPRATTTVPAYLGR